MCLQGPLTLQVNMFRQVRGSDSHMNILLQGQDSVLTFCFFIDKNVNKTILYPYIRIYEYISDESCKDKLCFSKKGVRNVNPVEE